MRTEKGEFQVPLELKWLEAGEETGSKYIGEGEAEGYVKVEIRFKQYLQKWPTHFFILSTPHFLFKEIHKYAV